MLIQPIIGSSLENANYFFYPALSLLLRLPQTLSLAR